jgi:hypothetical protein
VSPPAIESEQNSDQTPKESRVATAGVIAANTVTLNDKPAPKGAKQESDVKHDSDLK